MIIFDADLEEETIRAAVDRFFQLIQSKGAEPGHVDYWGKRRFAYEINHRTEGYACAPGEGRAAGDARVAPGALPG